MLQNISSSSFYAIYKFVNWLKVPNGILQVDKTQILTWYSKREAFVNNREEGMDFLVK